jgi:hypothetical protein
LGLRSLAARLAVVVPVSVVVPAVSPPAVVVAVELGGLGVEVVLVVEPELEVVVVAPLVLPLVPVPDPAATLSPASATLSAALSAICSRRVPRLPGALSTTFFTCGCSSSWRALAVIWSSRSRPALAPRT